MSLPDSSTTGTDARSALIVDDDPQIRESLREWIERDGYRALEASDGLTALELLDEEVIDVLVLDLALPRVSGMEVLEQVKARQLDIPVVVVSGQGTIRKAVQTIKLGAVDFIEKPPDAGQTLTVIRRALARASEERDRSKSLAEAMSRYRMVGSSPAMQQVYRQIERAAPTRARVLIVGPSGTGKERIAQAIHRLSNRHEGPLVALNCAAIPESLIEDELFGHVRHAFTDAKADRDGCFVTAHGGTLLLDEVAEMSLMTQAKVLRAIETNEVLPVGSDRPTMVDVRVVSATNKSLENEVDRGNFREDLFYRLNVIPIQVPPLTARPEDIGPLIDHFLAHWSRDDGLEAPQLTPAALAKLVGHNWPGNVRELQNVVERLVVMSGSARITTQHVDEALRPTLEAASRGEPVGLREARAQFERNYITHSLQENAWRMKDTAAALGINRSHLWKKMQRLGIEVPTEDVQG